MKDSLTREEITALLEELANEYNTLRDAAKDEPSFSCERNALFAQATGIYRAINLIGEALKTLNKP